MALRPYGNEIILMIKARRSPAIITVLDLMGETRYVFSRTYDISFYLWAAVFYLIMVEALRRLSNWLERGITRASRAPTEPSSRSAAVCLKSRDDAGGGDRQQTSGTKLMAKVAFIGLGRHGLSRWPGISGHKGGHD